jgi:hypothetical protein
MNCPNCSTPLSLLAKFYPCTPEKVFKCPKCHSRFTETTLENWPICAACGELLDYDQVEYVNKEGVMINNSEESICRKCAEKFNENDVPWE